ncbi:MAG: MFS transporter, partial [Devosia sp.]|nr:MFS transporter [Devosia sp.]
AAILADARRFLKPDGTLIYITCSILPEENDDQVTAFLAANPEFASLDPQSLWQSAFGTGAPAGVATAGAGIALTPRLTGTDGFYLNALRRTP